ncbi:Recombinase [Desulfosporosinus sp. I2]|uniref:recombinase family protein n=1 Tax=Desulfosporosinus sp. I2 TaxID=1617025 RepID=UPI00061F89BF|nr:recombinase family protein [Desulfosporosinus sp. I2]KJR46053.1 Recombinase [Desulfosporosinus sp. I2]
MAQRHMPFGYKIIDGTVTILPEKADLIRKMFCDYIAGISLLQMAKDLTQQGISNANGKPSWNHGSIGKILSNCKYNGNDFYPAIVTAEIFKSVKAYREEKNTQLNRNTNYYANGITSTYPFSGKVVCGECGSVFKRYTEHHDKNKKCNWKCKRYIVDNRVCCKSGVVDDHQLEAAFIEIINRVLEKPDVIETHPTVKAVQESTELKKLTLQISSALHKSDSDSAELAELLFKKAAEQYRLSTIDDFEYQTSKLKAIFQTRKPITEFDEALFKATIKSITVEKIGQLRFELTNGVTLNTTYTLRGKGGIDHGKSDKNSISDPCRSDL